MTPVRLASILTLALVLQAFAGTEPLRALWVSPDWLLVGDRPYAPQEVRRIVRDAVGAVARLGANAIFLETLIRGQSITTCGTGAGSLPLYPLCRPACFVEGGRSHDLLSLFIEEGRARGIEVHAWIHCFYWRSDNEAFRKPWQDGPTIYDDLLVNYLRRAGGAVRSLTRRRASSEMAQALSAGFSWAQWGRVARKWGIDSFEGSFNNFVRFVESCDGPPPDFMLTNPKGELHYGMEQDRILAIYVNPEHPSVAGRILWVVQRIARTYPGLAGIHLDHIRYPRGAFGGPGAFAAFPKAMQTTVYSPNRFEVGPIFDSFLARREACLTAIVQQARRIVPSSMMLTAAVHPTYYEERDSAEGAIPMETYMSQDWARWPIDFAVPMIYNATPARVDHLLGRARQAAGAGSGGVRVMPGVSSRAQARSFGSGRSWALFDFEGLYDLVPGIPGSALPGMGLKDRLF